MTDAGLKRLAGLKDLEHLNIGHNIKVTDACLEEIGGLRQLRTLNLQYIRVTDAGNETPGRPGKHLQRLKLKSTG